MKRVGKSNDMLTVRQMAVETGLPETLIRACLKEGHPTHLAHIAVKRWDGKTQTYIRRSEMERWLEGVQR